MQKQKVKKILKLLKKEIQLKENTPWFKDPFKTLIATVLSQRTKDPITERVSKKLFSRFPSAKKLSKARIKEIEKLIKPSGFYRVKAKRLKKISQEILKKFNGKVPNDLEALLELKGVGRKTANVVLASSFKIPAIAVDTHVHRISNRIGLVKEKKPFETEKSLMNVIPKNEWLSFNYRLVLFGQRKCFPRNPKCTECILNKLCIYGINKLNSK